MHSAEFSRTATELSEGILPSATRGGQSFLTGFGTLSEFPDGQVTGAGSARQDQREVER